MLEIDGSQGEGGGQVLRTALALACVTGHEVRISNIRARRKNPGLAPQHMAGVVAAGRICNAEIKGATLRSQVVVFRPGSPPQPGEYHFDVSQLSGTGSAGAVTLLLQTVWLPLALAEGTMTSRLVLKGGTHVNWSPPAHYVREVLLPVLAHAGVEASLTLDKWGWYPKGGGQVTVSIKSGATMRGVDFTAESSISKVAGVGVAGNLPAHIAHRIAARADNLLGEAGLPRGIQPERVGGASTGAGIFAWTQREDGLRAGFSALGERGKPSEVVAEEAIKDLVTYAESGYTLDRYLPDQLLPALALAEGPSALATVEITQHTLTNIQTVKHFFERAIIVEGALGGPGVVRVAG